MALAALAPLIGSLGGEALASGTLGSMFGLGGLASGIGGLGSAAIGSGLGTLAATGDVGKSLESGLLGYGLGGLTGGFGGGSGASAVGSAANPLGTVAGAPAASLDATAAGQLAAAQGIDPASLINANSITNGATIVAPGGTAVSAAGSPGITPIEATASNPVLANGMIQNTVPSFTQTLPGAAGVGGMHGLMQGLATAYPGLETASAYAAQQAQNAANPTYTSPGLTKYTPRTAVAIPQSFQPGVSPEMSYFAGGSGFANGGQIDAPMAATAMGLTPTQQLNQQLAMQKIAPDIRGYAIGGNIQADSMGQHMLNHEIMRQGMPFPKPAPTALPNFSSAVHKFAGGGDLSGLGAITGGGAGDLAVPPVAGDGSSDNIPATIDGNSPALLSSNEHVIPSDVVSHLGNGSSAAGHKQLKNMVKRVRLAKTGSAGLPPRINPGKMLPA